MSKKTASAADGQPESLEVTLVKEHTHGRQSLKPGATITVTADQKAWLEAKGVIGTQEELTHG
jgi:hypothetical protein